MADWLQKDPVANWRVMATFEPKEKYVEHKDVSKAEFNERMTKMVDDLIERGEPSSLYPGSDSSAH